MNSLYCSNARLFIPRRGSPINILIVFQSREKSSFNFRKSQNKDSARITHEKLELFVYSSFTSKS